MSDDRDRELLEQFCAWLWDEYGSAHAADSDDVAAFLATRPGPCGARDVNDGGLCCYVCELPAGHDGPHVECWGGDRRHEWK